MQGKCDSLLPVVAGITGFGLFLLCCGSPVEARDSTGTKVSLGVTVKAGPGVRKVARGKGQWKTFGVADGLPNPVIAAILQDRAGNLWFGTGGVWDGAGGGGIVRYDGVWFTTFTTKDGLASDRVSSLLEDRAGQLWFGTWGGGVSRYDGKHFTTFTRNEGLAYNTVFSIVEDRVGHL